MDAEARRTELERKIRNAEAMIDLYKQEVKTNKSKLKKLDKLIAQFDNILNDEE